MKRREFLGKTLAGTAGLSIGASSFLASSCKGANEKIVLALIGAGPRGLHGIISCCSANANVVIKTICDVDDSKLAAGAAEIEKLLGYRPAAARDMKEVLDDRDVDAVWVATPGHWNALAATLACKAGKDVYVETPSGNSITEAGIISEAAAKHRRIVQTGFQNRSAVYAASARDYIMTGKLGQVVHIRIFNLAGGTKWEPVPDSPVPAGLNWDAWLGPAPEVPYNLGRHTGWQNWWAYSPGTMNEAAHQLDLARMVIGDPGHPESVYGWGGNHIHGSHRETPELQSATFDFKKFTMTCESGDTTAYMSGIPHDLNKNPDIFPEWKTCAEKIEIYGTLGFMYLGRDGGGWQVYGTGEKIVAQEGGTDADAGHGTDFIECIRSRKEPNASPMKTYGSMVLAHMANIACRTGNRQLAFDPGKLNFTGDEAAGKLLMPVYRENYGMPGKI